MSKQLTILLNPLDVFGQVFPFIGIGQSLQNVGHRIVFATDHLWRGKLSKFGFEEELIYDPNETLSKDAQASEKIIQLFLSGLQQSAQPIERYKVIFSSYFKYSIDKMHIWNEQLNEIINRTKPDIIFANHFFLIPALINANVPWVQVLPGNPLFSIETICEDVPPGFSGLPSNDKSQWKEFRDQIKEFMIPYYTKYSDWLTNYNLKLINPSKLMNPSPYLNIYQFPKELDYTDSWTPPNNWVQFDSFMRLETDDFDMPENLKDKQGKLIYFSMGSLGSGNVEMMKRLIKMLSESSHKFIIAKGAYSTKFDLPDNCWGDSMIPQTKILPLVDLAIIHGGNNSLCESFYFGKPVIIMPLFSDQYDNAQRIEETGYGIRLDPFTCTKEQLLNAINTLVNDEQLKIKMKSISQRAQDTAKSNKIAQLINKLACQN